MPQGRETAQLARMFEEVSMSDAFCLTVDYSKPFHKMASSRWYLLKDGIITEEHFPIIPNGNSGIVELNAYYISWPFPVYSKMAAEGIRMVGKKRSWQKAEIQHMFALGFIQPLGLHSGRRVVALGSTAVIKGKHRVPCMGQCASMWNLAASPLDREWDAGTDFLVFSRRVRRKFQ